LLEGLARNHTLVRYDARGNGLSDWDVDELSLEAWVGDLETVVDAAGIERFPLLGISQGCAISIAYAVRHPERLSHLILYGGFALGGIKRSP
jgi:pimeloyl-ACP methyl ester carboxylesterase